ncbi:MAG: biotin transporter BioY [Ectobacillus sp.]
MKTRKLVFVALFSAIMAVLGFLPPITLSFTPVPITLQTLGVMLAGGLLGARLGAASMGVFLLVVAAGAPLLSGGRGGLTVFVGPSAGYLIGWVAGAFIIGLIVQRFKEVSVLKVFAANIVGGIFVVYLFGVTVQAFVMDIGIIKALTLSLVYIPGDLLKATVAALLVPRLYKSLQWAHGHSYA